MEGTREAHRGALKIFKRNRRTQSLNNSREDDWTQNFVPDSPYRIKDLVFDVSNLGLALSLTVPF